MDAVLNHLTARYRSGLSYGGKFFDAAGGYFPDFIFPDFTPRQLCPSTSGTDRLLASCCIRFDSTDSESFVGVVVVVAGDVDDYMVPENVRNCYLSGFLDLYGSSDKVRREQTAYLNRLVDLGVAGVRIDSAKHMFPEVNEGTPPTR